MRYKSSHQDRNPIFAHCPAYRMVVDLWGTLGRNARCCATGGGQQGLSVRWRVINVNTEVHLTGVLTRLST